MFFKYLPSKMLAFTAFYPFLAFWLIWGGTIWVPIFAMVGFGVGYLAWKTLLPRSFAAGFFGAIVATLLTWWIGGFITGILAPENPFFEAVPSP